MATWWHRNAKFCFLFKYQIVLKSSSFVLIWSSAGTQLGFHSSSLTHFKENQIKSCPMTNTRTNPVCMCPPHSVRSTAKPPTPSRNDSQEEDGGSQTGAMKTKVALRVDGCKTSPLPWRKGAFNSRTTLRSIYMIWSRCGAKKQTQFIPVPGAEWRKKKHIFWCVSSDSKQ